MSGLFDESEIFVKSSCFKQPALKKIFAALDYEARLVGGCVRDMILGKPIKDIDIATPLLPEDVTKRLTLESMKVVPIGIKFGTVMAVIDDKSYEITTLRKDISCDGRHAEVEYTINWQEDAARRDFTINAMYADLEGRVYDYNNGLQDIETGTIKFVGNAKQRCREDFLRILRFFRFYAYYGKDPVDREALQACAELAFGIDQLSGERIAAEMYKLLEADTPVNALLYMRDTGIITRVLPGYMEFASLEKLVVLERMFTQPACPIRRLACIIRSLLPSTQDILDIAVKWKLSNEDKVRLLALCLPCFDLAPDANIMDQKKILYKVGREIFIDLVLLKWAEERAEKQKGDDYREYYIPMLELAHNWRVPSFPVKGRDLLAIGYKPGKKLGVLLDKAVKWWEDQDYVPGREEIIAAIKEGKIS